MRYTASVFVLCTIISLILASPPESSIAACNDIHTKTTAKILIYPAAVMDPDYHYAKNHYWSAANADLTPACVVLPTTAKEVSDIVSVLINHNDVPFALKSGGHNPNVGFSSTEGGVLISFSLISSTNYDEKAGTADVRPGARWQHVITALEHHNVTVVGGRIGDVGVGGYLLGGGLSYLSSQYGMACDTIVNYEVVLANASIVNANANSNVDLFWALKGGGNQFGIVTKFTMKTFPMGPVWGGYRVYNSKNAPNLINATHRFTQNFHDPKAAIIVTAELVSSVTIFVVFFFYDGPVVPDGVFNEFNALKTIIDHTSVKSYATLLTDGNTFNLYGMRYLMRGITLPNLPDQEGTDLLNYHYTSWSAYSQSSGEFTTAYSMAFQPFPIAIPAASAKYNPLGNALGLDASYGDHMWMEYNLAWLTSLSDDTSHKMAMNVTSTIEAYAEMQYKGVKSSNYLGKEVDAATLDTQEYRPTFMNDAMFDQKPLQDYGSANYERLKSIQRSVDPHGFFGGSRQGGFKFT